MKKIILIKLGGSLITDKTKPFTAREAIIVDLVRQIKEALLLRKDINLIVGNGGGSFPHYPAVKYQMQQGIKKESQKIGFALVQDAAARLNRIIVKHFLEQKLIAVSLSPSSFLIAKGGKVKKIFLSPLEGLISLNLIPVIYGDIVYDEKQGAKIFSTEELLTIISFNLLKKGYFIEKVIHNGLTCGVLDENGNTIEKITKKNFNQFKAAIKKAKGYDVTGGMLHKITQSLELAKYGVRTLIINGVESKDVLKKAILGEKVKGTIIE